MEKKTKMSVCSNCNAEIPKNAKVCPSCGAKNKKPLYKKWWVILLAVIALIGVISNIAGNREERFDWNEIVLRDRLPQPKSNVGSVISNESDNLYMHVEHLSQNDYEAYVAECQSMGYTVESEKDGNRYDAFDDEGYGLSLSYIGESMSISLEAPMEMGTLNWPKSDLTGLLPVPRSTVGKVETDTADSCVIYVGDTPLEDYSAYVDECADSGFALDHDRGDKYYHADDENGNHLSLTYEGNKIMRIDLAKADETEATGESKPAVQAEQGSDPAKTEDQDDALVDGMRPEYKEAMDSYEAFINEYCDFMNKYAESDGTDLSMLSDYTDYLDKYTEMMQDFEAWEDNDLNTAEAAYYAEVQSRVSQKLIEAAQAMPDTES